MTSQFTLKEIISYPSSEYTNEIVVAIRSSLDLTQADVANALHLTQGGYRGWELAPQRLTSEKQERLKSVFVQKAHQLRKELTRFIEE